MSAIVCEVGDCTITTADLSILQSANSWLNDNIITYYMESVESVPDDVVMIQPSSAFMLRMLPPEDLTSAVGTKPNPFVVSQDPRTRFIVVPLNDADDPTCAGGSHWSLLVLDKQLVTARHYDSSSGHNRRVALETCHYLGKLLHIDKIRFEEPKCYQQTNSHDCGVFLLLNLRSNVLKHSVSVDRDAAIEFRKELLGMVMEDSRQQSRHQ